MICPYLTMWMSIVSLRFVKHKGIHVTYTVGEDEGKIQFKRALESLGIGVIYAHSLKDKGKDRKTV